MKRYRTWLWIGGAVAAASAPLALGVPVVTLLIVAAALACPVTMYLGMRGMRQNDGGMACHPGGADQPPPAGRQPTLTPQDRQ